MQEREKAWGQTDYSICDVQSLGSTATNIYKVQMLLIAFINISFWFLKVELRYLWNFVW